MSVIKSINQPFIQSIRLIFSIRYVSYFSSMCSKMKEKSKVKMKKNYCQVISTCISKISIKSHRHSHLSRVCMLCLKISLYIFSNTFFFYPWSSLVPLQPLLWCVFCFFKLMFSLLISVGRIVFVVIYNNKLI